MEDYRGITLLNSIYKVYAMVVERRLGREMEEKELPDSQAGFRKGRGIVNRELQRERGGVFAFFVDLRVVFDSMDREKLWKALKEKGVSEGLRERLKEI